jgi:hypothetical protein
MLALPLKSYALVVLIAATLPASFPAGCLPAKSRGSAPGGSGSKPPPKQLVLDPQVVKSVPVSYWAYSDEPGAAISPDGKYVLMVQRSQEGSKVAAVPLTEGAGERDVVLYSVGREWIEKPTSALEYVSVSWMSNTRCLFLSSGLQSQGPNKGKSGIAVLAGDVSTGTSEEIAFITLTEGLAHSVKYVPSAGRLFLHVTQSIWGVDVNAKSVKLVKGGLPPYDSLFMARISPDATALVYELHEGSTKQGVFILDTGTGAEKPFLTNGETMSFYPTWSPDGKYLALYTVGRRPGAKGTTWDNYEVYLGEDGPQSVAPVITIADRSGKVVRTVTVEGRVLANFQWSWDSGSIAFVTGLRPASTPDAAVDWEVPSLPWEGLWTANVLDKDAAPAKLADLAQGKMGAVSYARPVAFDTGNKGVYLQVDVDNGASSVWYAAMGKAPVQSAENEAVKVSDGHWQYYPKVTAYGDTVVAIISGPGGPTGLWLLNPKGFVRSAQWTAASTAIVGFNADTLVTQQSDGSGGESLVVRAMYRETQ